MMKFPAHLPVVLLCLILAGALFAFQDGGSFLQQYQELPNFPKPDPNQRAEFAFTRLAYRGFRDMIDSRWLMDFPEAEQHFSVAIGRLTRVDIGRGGQMVDLDSDEIFNWPWLYAVEVGSWGFTDSEAKRLRDYLDRGGFLMVDDFHGSLQWKIFEISMQQVLPDRPIVDLPDNSEIFHVVHDLSDRFQVPGEAALELGQTWEPPDGQIPHWRGILDDNGRIMVAICHDMDIGDGWELADRPDYPERYASLAFRIGVNYVIYAMTH